MTDAKPQSIKGPDDLEPVVPNAKDVSKYPGNEAGTVQPTTAVSKGDVERENDEREARRLSEEKRHHEECGS